MDGSKGSGAARSASGARRGGLRAATLRAATLRAATLLAASCALVFAARAVSGCSGAHEGGDAGDEGGVDGGAGDAAPTCPSGSACGDGGVCAGGSCCSPKAVCGDACCGSGQLCSFQKCVTPGGPCTDDSDCKSGEYCDFSLGGGDGGTPPSDAGCMGGKQLPEGRCMPKPPICPPDAGAGDGGLACLESCEYRNMGAFAPQLKYAWGGQVTAPYSTDVMMAPIVIELDDDNCDGKVTELDIPEIVFTTFTGGDYSHNGTLHAISIVGGQVKDKWSKAGEVYPGTQLAGGDLEANGKKDVVACGTDGTVHAYRGDGSLLWKSSAGVGCYMPSIADLDQDGKPEVIVEGGVLNGATGATKATWSAPMSGTFAVSDIDGDGQLDVVTSSQAYHASGSLFIDTGVPGNWPAIGDFDKDGKPEVVAVYYASHTVSLWHYDQGQMAKFSWMRQGVDINGTLTQHCPVGSSGYTHGGGPPTVADFDGDAVPDVALAGGIGYAILNGAKLANSMITNPNTLLWAAVTTDCSSAATGSSVFDFDGDGKAEVIYSDENHLRIYEGPTGNVLWQACNTTGTLVEYPLVADVDNDGHADIVVVSNAYASPYSSEYQCNDGTNIAQSGVHVFGDTNGTWVRTRRVWNEHAYHITNVAEDGTIPAKELPNWTQPGLNNFRQNKQPGSEFAAPDAIVSLQVDCGGAYNLVATVRNVGEALLPAGATVKFYAGSPPSGTLLGSAQTTIALGPAQAELVSIGWPMAPQNVMSGKVYATVEVALPTRECRTDNDTSAPVDGACPTVR